MLIAATNPCPCGYAGDAERCRCSETDMARHRRKLSGPLLDRIDLQAKLESSASEGLGAEPWTSSERARERVHGARERQARRLRGECATRERADGRAHARTARAAGRAGAAAVARGPGAGTLSARGQHRTLRVARTIADLDGCERVRMRDVGVALSLRPETGLHGSRAA